MWSRKSLRFCPTLYPTVQQQQALAPSWDARSRSWRKQRRRSRLFVCLLPLAALQPPLRIAASALRAALDVDNCSLSAAVAAAAARLLVLLLFAPLLTLYRYPTLRSLSFLASDFHQRLLLRKCSAIISTSCCVSIAPVFPSSSTVFLHQSQLCIIWASTHSPPSLLRLSSPRNLRKKNKRNTPLQVQIKLGLQ